MKMHNPPHPGGIIKRTIVDALGLSVTEFADHLRMSRVAISRVLNGRAKISPELAIRLEMARFSHAAFWLRLQADYDLWQAEQLPRPQIQPINKEVIEQHSQV